MSERGGRRFLRRNIEDEAQLLAEEKWLIDTLKTVRGQINCMQIERLHLMTLLEQYEDSVKSQSQKEGSAQTQPALVNEVSEASDSKSKPEKVPYGTRSTGFELDEATGEELDLTVSQSVFGKNPNYTVEEFEEENDLDTEEGNENVFVDMHMLMNFQNEDNQESF